MKRLTTELQVQVGGFKAQSLWKSIHYRDNISGMNNPYKNSELNLEKIRSDTPATSALIHFNNAGSSLTAKPVLAAVLNHLELEQKIGGYEAAETASAKIESFYPSIATLLHCHSNEVAYVENATRAWDMLFYAIPFKRGDRVITGQSEYASNYMALMQLKKEKGIAIEVIPNDQHGRLSLQLLRNAIDERVKLIAVTHIPSQNGVIHPAEEVGKIAKENGILYLLDACQSVGQMDLDVTKIGCDMLTGTGRKYLRGPRGTGFLYVNNKILHQLTPPFIDLHAAEWLSAEQYRFREDAKRFENWERFIAGQIGLAVAAQYACNLGLPLIQKRVKCLASHARDKLERAKNIEVFERKDHLSGIITFTKHDEQPNQLKLRLRENGVNISVILRKNTQLDFAAGSGSDRNRLSLHYYNTMEEIDQFIDLL